DGRPATIDAARDRLARMIGADRDTFTAADALTLARAADRTLLSRLVTKAQDVCQASIGEARCAVISGSGEFLARRVAQAVLNDKTESSILKLSDLWGHDRACAACAWALVLLVSAREDNDTEIENR